MEMVKERLSKAAQDACRPSTARGTVRRAIGRLAIRMSAIRQMANDKDKENALEA